jgi:hypothetical protein
MSEAESYEAVLVLKSIVCPALTLTSLSPELEPNLMRLSWRCGALFVLPTLMSPNPELVERLPEYLSLNLMRLSWC